ncbi:MAG: hypothetical protein CVT60_04725 [Actinobacteria bacterium HGW-Actinobacteria-10]|nr:MAG: hypothetical protein CVT60_04725 [Actinobacteria bacterium HGW-Actinobacteria-10]
MIDPTNIPAEEPEVAPDAMTPTRRPQPVGTDAPVRRRRIVRAAIVIAAFAVLGLVPALLTLQPTFYRHIDSLAGQYEPWSTSTHAEAGCEACHASPRAPAQALRRARMVGEFYLMLAAPSRAAASFPAPTNESCLECHSELRTVSPEGDLRIPHRAHVAILEMECVECHQYVVHELSPEGGHTPTMAGCLTCHDGEKAKNDCWACHTEKGAPDTHATKDWLIAHADHSTDPECETCHKWRDESWCVECHSHRPQSHTSDWRAVHGDRIQTHRSCEACHEEPFCARCHGRLPQLNLDPTLGLVR